MAIYTVKLTRREETASGTIAFHFDKPHGFSCKAVQFGDFTLASPPETDAEGNVRTFTLASAPPPAMVAAMRKLLDDSGVTDNRIRTEKFSGY